MSDDLVVARKGTFEAGAGWPHESKRGWKCKLGKMVEAGWCLDPAPSGEEGDGDGVTCFYCHLSLDGWEPKDDPLEEHRRRSPECAFFALVEKFGSATAKKGGRGKGGKKTVGGSGSAASRLSTLSTVSTAFSEAPSFADVGAGEAEAVGVDDSIVSTATTASQATATGAKGKKKGGRSKAATKGAKGRKRANTVESEAEAELIYPDLSTHMLSQATQEEDTIALSQPAPVEDVAPPPAKKTRKGTRQSKQQTVDSSVMEISSLDPAPPKRATRERKVKAQPEPEPEPEQEAECSEVSAQLHEELERSMSLGGEAVEQGDEATPQPETAKPKRGVKRTSEGLRKKGQDDEEEKNAVIVEFPVPPKAAPVAKGKKGRKPSKQVAVDESETSSQLPASTQEDVPMSDAEVEPAKPTQTKKKALATKGKSAKGRKPSSTRSSRSSKATIAADLLPTHASPSKEAEEEDLDRDEREISAELQRIASEQQHAVAVEAEQEKAAEFEASPSHHHAQKHVNQIRQLEQELQAEVQRMGAPGENLREYVGRVAAENLDRERGGGMSSPSGSDKENWPEASVVLQSSAAKKQTQQAAAPIPSPTKSTRTPLAPGTPNRLSPSKRNNNLILSPSKHLSKLTSTQPWEPVLDLDTLLLASPQATPGTLAHRFAGAAGGLTSLEKGLTVEAWVRFQAEKAEGELRGRCEALVGVLEREGMRAVGAVGGIVVV